MKKNDSCEIYCYDEEKVTRLQQQIEKEDILGIVKMFKVLADDNRSKIAYALSQEGELCVCDIANIVGSSVATASHHLRTLKNMELATYRKEGKLAFYSLDDNHIKQIMMIALAHKKEVTQNV